MTKRSKKNFKLLEQHEKLTPEVRDRLLQDKKRLQKELDFIEKLLKKPITTKGAAQAQKKKKRKAL